MICQRCKLRLTGGAVHLTADDCLTHLVPQYEMVMRRMKPLRDYGTALRKRNYRLYEEVVALRERLREMQMRQ